MIRRNVLVLMALLVAVGTVWAGEEVTTPPEKDKGKATEAERAKEVIESVKSEEQKWYEALVKAYMRAQWDEFDELLKQSAKMQRALTHDQRTDIRYVRTMTKEHRPTWWKHCHSSGDKSFQAKIWGKSFTANYRPSEMLGIQAVVGIDPKTKRLQIIVSWRPAYVDSPKPFSNDKMGMWYGISIPNAKDYGFTMGNMAETIIWHELGHNYISIKLSPKAVIALYNRYRMLYSHLQEFYADLTALYHGSPNSRLFTMMFRRQGLVYYDESGAHDRGCSHAVGALLLAKMLMEPELWPSFHFPGKVPEEDIERNTIMYLYHHIDPNYTLHEDKSLREFVGQWCRTKGEIALRTKGKIQLPNKLDFWVMAGDDHKAQAERDKWITEKLEKLIASGRADDPKIYEKDMEDSDGETGRIIVEIRRGKVKIRKKDEDKEDDKKKDEEEDEEENEENPEDTEESQAEEQSSTNDPEETPADSETEQQEPDEQSSDDADTEEEQKDDEKKDDDKEEEPESDHLQDLEDFEI